LLGFSKQDADGVGRPVKGGDGCGELRNSAVFAFDRLPAAALELAGSTAHIDDAMIVRALVIAILMVGGVAATGRATAAEVAAPFDGGLARLSEILGSLHYLRGICGANEGNKWRAEMQALLDAEAPSGERRARFIAHFNRGYRAYLQTYRTCTPAADLVIRRYLEEGSKIAREVTARYSN
jgi:uncharacterized protein (TIGR02301 family)